MLPIWYADTQMEIPIHSFYSLRRVNIMISVLWYDVLEFTIKDVKLHSAFGHRFSLTNWVLLSLTNYLQILMSHVTSPWVQSGIAFNPFLLESCTYWKIVLLISIFILFIELYIYSIHVSPPKWNEIEQKNSQEKQFIWK